MRSTFAVAAAAAFATCAVGSLAIAAPASAVVPPITASTVTVTSPTGTCILADEVTPHQTMTLTGTSDGTTGDTVDIGCYAGAGFRVLALGVTVQSDGTFMYSGPFNAISGATCVLRAVPAGDRTSHPPGSPSPFTGPTLVISDVSQASVVGGPNNGTLESYYLYDSQLRGAFDYDSLGACTITDSYTYDPVTFAGAALDYCDAWFDYANGRSVPGFVPPTRSELQVDGANAYVAASVSNFDAASGSRPRTSPVSLP